MTKAIPASERLIVALDLPDAAQARQLVERLGDSVRFYKLGLELFTAGGYFELAEWLHARGNKTFADLKLFDVPNTVASAVRSLRKHRPAFVTVHGNDAILRAACAEKGDIKVLAVTVLTSLDDGDLKELGFQAAAKDVVISRAKRALEIGCDGVISSGLEAEAIRDRVGGKLLIVCPGIRPIANTDDQKRVVDVATAFKNGADYIVVGRPITQAPDPAAAAREIQATIARVFPGT